MNNVAGGAAAGLRAAVEQAVNDAPILDIHTHLYDPAFGSLLLWGIDDLLFYHYLIAETFRYYRGPADQFWSMTKEQQTSLIWDELFLKHSPISEACRGVITTLNALGLDPNKRDLPALRKWFAQWQPGDYITKCMELSGVRQICMTNSPFDAEEAPVWQKGFLRDERFLAALRIDPILVSWSETAPKLAAWGYDVRGDLGGKTFEEVRRFLRDWTKRMGAKYCMVSLSPDFQFPENSPCGRLIENAILPHCREFGLPFALMMGVKRAVNPELRLAGDGVGLANLGALQALCAGYPQNKFLVTVLARENQHELCVLARKFRNLHVFGCWWFTNVPLIVEEMTRMRLELIGLSVTPQHSDARVLDQIVYKWRHSKAIIAKVLADKYELLAEAGWIPTKAEIERDARQLLGGAFQEFLKS